MRFKRAREAFKKLKQRMKGKIVSGKEVAHELGVISIHDEANSASSMGIASDHSYEEMLASFKKVESIETEHDLDVLVKANEEAHPAIEMVKDPQDKILGDEPIRAVHGTDIFVSWLKNQRVDVYVTGPKTDKAEFFRVVRNK